MKLAALAGFAAGTVIVVYTFLRQQSDSEIVITLSYEMDGAGYEPAPPAVILADPRRN